jgi:hypothetical protein
MSRCRRGQPGCAGTNRTTKVAFEIERARHAAPTVADPRTVAGFDVDGISLSPTRKPIDDSQTRPPEVIV